MRGLKLMGILVTASFLVGTIASAEPAKPTPPAKKHAECEGSKVKTACNQAADVKEFVTGRQVKPASPTTPTTTTTSAQAVEPANDGTAEAQQPK